MREIFLSASIPRPGRGDYHKTADPFLIQHAVRELVMAVIRTRRLVWGGHPAITPMVLRICEDLNVDYAASVILYQSRYFEREFPRENAAFANVILVDAIPGDQPGSLARMREEMLSRRDLEAAVFIGGMDGVEAEWEMFRRLHPEAVVLAVPSPGGAARALAGRLGQLNEATLQDVDFGQIFRTNLGLDSPADSTTSGR